MRFAPYSSNKLRWPPNQRKTTHPSIWWVHSFLFSVNFTFSCPGHESAAEVEVGYNVVVRLTFLNPLTPSFVFYGSCSKLIFILKNICGDSPELSFIANEDLNMAEIRVSFSGDTQRVDADHVLMTFRKFNKDPFETRQSCNSVLLYHSRQF